MKYKSLSGTKYILENKQMNKGGEGRIYEIINYGSAIAKLYNDDLCTSHRENKLITMLRIQISSNLEKQIAWPRDILYKDGKLAGFVMRKIQGGVSLNEIWSDDSLDISKRITIAKNLCALLYEIHAAGLVVGDLNPFNILVIPVTGMVRIIDVDSWHISDQKSGACFRCEVCVPEYLSPIIANSLPKGETLKTAPLPTFSTESDLYSLAVLLFQLLMNGTHPNAVGLAKGNTSEDVPQPAELMRKYQFPFEKCPDGYRLPVYSLPYKVLSLRLQAMFSKIFTKRGNIPIERWYDALSEFAEKDITKICRDNTAHKYRGGLYKCPYCATIRNKEKFFRRRKNGNI